MIKCIGMGVLACLFLLLAASSSSAVEPAAMEKKALSLIQSAKGAESNQEYESAKGRYELAEKTLKSIQKEHPKYNPAQIKAQIGECAEKVSELDNKLYPLPDGCIEITSGMDHGGNRFTKGKALVQSVKKEGEGEYKVSDYTISIVKSGPKTGASCTCPDFKFQLKEGLPCKHIWAVALKEKLVKEAKSKKP